MKRNKSHIVFACLLLINLFFTQIMANFLHDEHCEKYHTAQKISTSEASFKADEKCTICSLDLFHELVFNQVKDFLALRIYQVIIVSDPVLSVKTIAFSSPRRSPPAC